MLTQQEVEAGVDRLLESLRRDYPEPGSVLRLLDMIEVHSGGVAPLAKLIENLLPEGWLGWYRQTVLFRARQRWGDDAIRSMVNRMQQNLSHYAQTGDEFLVAQTQRELVIAREGWSDLFPKVGAR